MPPVVIAAGVTAASSIGGAALAGKSQKNAVNSANATAQATNASNNALALDIYGRNTALLSPYSERGNQAGTAINALLGLGGPPQPQTIAGGYPQQVPVNALASPYDNGDGRMYRGRAVDGPMVGDRGLPPYQHGAPQPTSVTPQPGAGGSPYEAAFNTFLNSTGFRFQMDEGNRAVNTGYAANGTLQSGAAMKALQDRGQQTALGNYFLPYMGLLQGQQGVGMGAASAVAGVGQNYANSVMANNNLAGETAQNAALARGAANSSMYLGVGNALGTAAGTIFGTSYKKRP